MNNYFFNLSLLNDDEIDFYIFSIKNINIYINKTIQEISKIYGCGISFIYKFFSKLGVNGLKDFIYKIGFNEGLKSNILDDTNKITDKYSIENIEKYLLINYSLNIKQNLNMLKKQICQIKDLCKQIKIYKKVYGFGIGHAEICVKDLFGIFSKFKIECHQFFKLNNSNKIPKDLSKLQNEKSIFLVYSFRGVHNFTEKLIKFIKIEFPNIIIWLITSNLKSPFIKYADKTIFINNNVKEINYIDNPILISLVNSFIFFNDFLKNMYVLEEYELIKKNKDFINEIENLRTGKN